MFIVSWIDSLLILPAHLSSRSNSAKGLYLLIDIPNKKVQSWLSRFIERVYVPLLRKALHFRYVVLTASICALFLTIFFLIQGFIPFRFQPKIGSNVITASALITYGDSMEISQKTSNILYEAVKRVEDSLEEKGIVRGIYTQIGAKKPLENVAGVLARVPGNHLIQAQVALIPQHLRKITPEIFIEKWKQKIGTPPEIEQLTFVGVEGISKEAAIELDLSHSIDDVLDRAVMELANILRSTKGVKEVDLGESKGKSQRVFRLTQEARSLNLTSQEVASQVRNAFYGAEAVRQVQGQEEQKVLVRLPESERKRLETIENLILRTSRGGEIPISEATEVVEERSFPSILRKNGKNVHRITALINPDEIQLGILREKLEKVELPYLQERYFGLSYTFGGEQEDEDLFLSSMKVNYMIAVAVIYTLLAIVFNHYFHPFLVMIAIPFGLVGAITAHVLMGYEVTMTSLMGVIALSGVVINDSLVLILAINSERAGSQKLPLEGVVEGGKRRFRPIIITSLTTFFGLLPMIIDSSLETQFLTPMAISLGFGVLFATFITLILIPALYLIVEDVVSRES